MKRILLVLAAVLLISGAAWGQFDWMYAVNTGSTEATTSAGIYTSRVDDYISFMDYDPEIGKFIFVGGRNEFYTSASAVTIGHGKTLESGYLGLYFSGNFLTAQETKVGGTTTVDNTNWNTDFALLYGFESGAIRLDAQLRNDVDIVFGFTYSGFKLFDSDAYITAGFDTEDDAFGVQAGIRDEKNHTIDVAGLFYKDFFGVAIRGTLNYLFEFEKFGFGISPLAVVGFDSMKIGSGTNTGLWLYAGINAGAYFQVTQRFKLYTGAGVRVLYFESDSYDSDNKSWSFAGPAWNNSLAVGLTFTPVENFVIGMNVTNYSITTAPNFNAALNFVVSYKY